MAYTQEFKNECINLMEAGVPVGEVAKEQNVTRASLNNWRKAKNKKELSTDESIKQIKKQIATLSKRTPTAAVSRNLAMLSASLARLEGIERKKKKRLEVKKKNKPNIIDSATVKNLKQKMLHPDYGLREYQKKFLASNARFRIWLKARQIGATYSCAGEALVEASGGMEQIIVSASEDQALKWREEIETHATKLGINIGDNAKKFKANNAGTIRILANNYRTSQSYSGSLWMDEFAWYQNPKKIWTAAVPMMGTKEVDGNFAKLTILSTPFEEPSLFHELWSNEEQYFVFERFFTDIYQAVEQGLNFDIETMKTLFDVDSWASAYECQFIDDESALMSIALIKSCVDYELSYYTPPKDKILYTGFDIGRSAHRSVLAGILSQKDFYETAMMDVLHKATFDEQELHLKTFLNNHQRSVMRIDKTGIGMQLAENMYNKYKSRVTGVYFTNVIKERLALNLKKHFEDKNIRIPNDPALISDIHAIKRIAGSKSFKYDAKANEYGHADRFWALALALYHIQTHKKASGSSGGAYLF